MKLRRISQKYIRTENRDNIATVYTGAFFYLSIPLPGQNKYPEHIRIHNGVLYCGVENSITGSQVWIWNGVAWTQMDSNGFGYSANTRIHAIHSISGRLFATTRNATQGGQIWEYTISGWSLAGDSGFGTSANYAFHSLANNNGVITVGVDNDTGCRVYSWR